MFERLGNVIYRLTCVFNIVVLLYCIVSALSLVGGFNHNTRPLFANFGELAALWIIVATISNIIGRSFKYVLSGK